MITNLIADENGKWYYYMGEELIKSSFVSCQLQDLSNWKQFLTRNGYINKRSK